MNIVNIKELFEKKFSQHIYTLSKISEDDTNHIPLCHYKNRFFDLEREYIVFVKYKNARIKDKAKIKQKFLDSFALFYKILDRDKNLFWSFKTYLLFVTSKEKNPNQETHRNYLSTTDELLDILEDNIILYGFDIYKPWYFNEIKIPFCDEFEKLMKQEFNIILEKEELI